MRLISAPGIGLAPLRGRLNFPGHSLTLIAKAKLALTPGGVARLLTERASIPTGDEPYPEDELGLGTPRYASDFAFQKPSADVLLVGHFHAPQQKPVRASEVALSIDEKTTRLAVIGRRRFHGAGRLPTANEAEPFNRLSLRWEHAYGGAGHTHNPVGTGYVAAERLGKTGGAPRDFAREPLELPRIERPDLLFTHLDQGLEPVCFAPRAATWPVRRNLFGKCDERWLKTRWPWFPEDFDPRYFMCALPALQQPGYLRGDETLRFKNMHPSIPSYESSLPGLAAIAVVQRLHADGSGDVTTEPVPLSLDTLWIDMDAEVAQLIWRGSLVCKDAEASDIRHAWVGLEARSLALSPAEIKERGERAIQDDEAQWNIVATAPPVPAGFARARTRALRPATAAPRAQEEAPDPELLAILKALPQIESEPLPQVSAEQQAQLAAATEQARAKLEARLRSEEQDEAAKKPPPWTRARVQSERHTPGALCGVDLSGLDLSGEDLSAVDLSRALLRGACLDRAKLVAADLSGASLEGASLNEADLSEAKLEDADLSNSQGTRLRLRGTRLTRANLSGCDLPELELSEVDLTLVHAQTARLPGARFERCQLDESNFERAQLEGASFRECTLVGARFVAAQLSGVAFVDCALKEADFEGAELSQASITKCNLDDALLETVKAIGLKLEASSVARLRAAGADLSFARFRELSGKDVFAEGARLQDAQLEQCDLPGADFSAVSFERARISGCSLVGAKLGKADLSDAQLLGSDCFEATFEAARLLRCDGSGSSFFRAEFLDAEIGDFYGQKRDLSGTKLAPAEG